LSREADRRKARNAAGEGDREGVPITVIVAAKRVSTSPVPGTGEGF
jgi:hypothetical protein